MEPVAVTLSPEGAPVAFTVAGDSWRVVEEPVRWYQRMNWWETMPRMPREYGRIDVEVWQLQARREVSTTKITSNGAQPLVTFVLVHDENTGEWSLRSAVENPD